MTSHSLFINVRVPRSSETEQVIKDRAPLPKGIIRWFFLGFIDADNDTTTAYVGFEVNGEKIPVGAGIALKQYEELYSVGYADVPSDYVPIAWVTGGSAGDSLQFVAIGMVTDAVPA
jgi:hypothetical protein